MIFAYGQKNVGEQFWKSGGWNKKFEVFKNSKFKIDFRSWKKLVRLIECSFGKFSSNFFSAVILIWFLQWKKDIAKRSIFGGKLITNLQTLRICHILRRWKLEARVSWDQVENSWGQGVHRSEGGSSASGTLLVWDVIFCELVARNEATES